MLIKLAIFITVYDELEIGSVIKMINCCNIYNTTTTYS